VRGVLLFVVHDGTPFLFVVLLEQKGGR